MKAHDSPMYDACLFSLINPELLDGFLQNLERIRYYWSPRKGFFFGGDIWPDSPKVDQGRGQTSLQRGSFYFRLDGYCAISQ